MTSQGYGDFSFETINKNAQNLRDLASKSSTNVIKASLALHIPFSPESGTTKLSVYNNQVGEGYSSVIRAFVGK